MLIIPKYIEELRSLIEFSYNFYSKGYRTSILVKQKLV